MNEIWTIVEPYVLSILGVLGGSSIVAVIARMICVRLINKAGQVYDVNALAKKVADLLGGKTIDVDITTLTEKKLQEVCNELSARVGDVELSTNSYKHLLALIGAAISHLKMLSEEEREALAAAIKELDSQYEPPKKEVIATVKLEPLEPQTQELIKSKPNLE